MREFERGIGGDEWGLRSVTECDLVATAQFGECFFENLDPDVVGLTAPPEYRLPLHTHKHTHTHTHTHTQ